MAVDYKNAHVLDVGTAPVDAFVAATDQTSILAMNIGNKLAAPIEVSVDIVLASGPTTVSIVKNAPVNSQGAFQPFGAAQKHVLNNGDKIVVTCNAANAADVFTSFAEKT